MSKTRRTIGLTRPHGYFVVTPEQLIIMQEYAILDKSRGEARARELARWLLGYAIDDGELTAGFGVPEFIKWAFHDGWIMTAKAIEWLEQAGEISTGLEPKEWISQSEAWELFTTRIAKGAATEKAQLPGMIEAVGAGISEKRFRSDLSKDKNVVTRGRGKGKRQYDKASFETWARAYWVNFNLNSDRRLVRQRNKRGLKQQVDVFTNAPEISKKPKF